MAEGVTLRNPALIALENLQKKYDELVVEKEEILIDLQDSQQQNKQNEKYLQEKQQEWEKELKRVQEQKAICESNKQKEMMEHLQQYQESQQDLEEKNQSLRQQLRKMKEELAQRELECHQLKIQCNVLTQERDKIIHDTEKEARKIRILWQQTMDEHERQQSVFKETALKFQLDKTQLQQENNRKNMTMKDMKHSIEELKKTNANLLTRQEEVQRKLEEKERVLSSKDIGFHDLQNQIMSRSEEYNTRYNKAVFDLQKLKVQYEVVKNQLKECQIKLSETQDEAHCIQLEFNNLLDQQEEFARDLYSEIEGKLKQERKKSQYISGQNRQAGEVIITLERKVKSLESLIQHINDKLSRVSSKPTTTRANTNAFSYNVKSMNKENKVDSNRNSFSIYHHLNNKL